MDMIKRMAMERTSKFFKKDNGIKEVKLEDVDGNKILCKLCNRSTFKLYTKFGGTTYGKRGKIINSVPVTYNFACICGEMLVIRENMFKYSKVKYGCKANKCPIGKVKMDKECLKCQYIYEK